MKTMILLACLCCTLFSCENVEKKAGEKLQTAREAFERGDFSEAKMQIDSIKILYPKAFETRREGISLMQQVELKEQEKTLVYLDSLLQKKQSELDAIKGKFTLEKDAEYQKIGNYLHPSQVIEKKSASFISPLSSKRNRTNEHDFHLLWSKQYSPHQRKGYRTRW